MEVLPGLHDDDVVEGLMAFAEAGQADADDHCGWAIKVTCSYTATLVVVRRVNGVWGCDPAILELSLVGRKS